MTVRLWLFSFYLTVSVLILCIVQKCYDSYHNNYTIVIVVVIIFSMFSSFYDFCCHHPPDSPRPSPTSLAESVSFFVVGASLSLTALQWQTDVNRLPGFNLTSTSIYLHTPLVPGEGKLFLQFISSSSYTSVPWVVISLHVWIHRKLLYSCEF